MFICHQKVHLTRFAFQILLHFTQKKNFQSVNLCIKTHCVQKHIKKTQGKVDEIRKWQITGENIREEMDVSAQFAQTNRTY